MDDRPEVTGPADRWLRERIEAFLTALEGDPWGADRPGRIAIAEDRKQFDALMQTHLAPNDYKAWAIKQTHSLQVSVAKACIATDGVKTIIAIVPDHARAINSGTQNIELLSSVCHEICHTTMVGLDRGSAPIAHAARTLIWMEHIVERRREALFRQLGWDSPSYDPLALKTWLACYYRVHSPRLLRSAEMPCLELEMLWLTLLNEYVPALGRARAGATAEAEGVAAFLAVMPDERRARWAALDAAADEAFGSSSATPAELDLIADRAWQPLHKALEAEFVGGYKAHAWQRKVLGH